MFPRTILSSLRQWRTGPNRKPLILRGARQVGKTVAVRLFGKEFDRYLEVNLERPGEAGVFSAGLTPHEIVSAISLRQNIPATQGSTLLFIDEIQSSPEAVSSLRFFFEDLPELCVIAAGSLLEVLTDEDAFSFPVGRVEYRYMFPLSFEEFLGALGETEALTAYQCVPCPAYAVERLQKLFHTYALIGGLPEAVAAYAASRDIAVVNSVYGSLMTSFADDIPKYAKNRAQAAVLRHCLESAPLEAGKRISFAGFGQSNYGSREAGEALRTLERAMILHLCYPSTSHELPIQPDLRKSPRLQFLDTGLLNFQAGIQREYVSIDNLHALYRGMLAEHIVGQELLCRFPDFMRKPVFWVRQSPQSNAEVDFIIDHKGLVVPIEVKAGATGSLKSLRLFMDMCTHDVAVRLYAGTMDVTPCTTASGKRFQLLSLPYCLAGRMEQHVAWKFGV